jgi:hypothetical protein
MTLEELKQSLALHTKRRKDALAKAYREAKVIGRRKKQIKVAKQPRNLAIAWAEAQLGTVEDPPGSNRGPKITAWQGAFGSWLIGKPWCGVFAGTALRSAGVKVNSRVAGVALICEDAEKGVNGWLSFSKDPTTARAGDAVVLFGRGTHVGLVIKNDRENKRLHTIEGNTSAGTTGSQSNGGGVYKRERPYTHVYGIAVPRYPS